MPKQLHLKRNSLRLRDFLQRRRCEFLPSGPFRIAAIIWRGTSTTETALKSISRRVGENVGRSALATFSAVPPRSQVEIRGSASSSFDSGQPFLFSSLQASLVSTPLSPESSTHTYTHPARALGKQRRLAIDKTAI